LKRKKIVMKNMRGAHGTGDETPSFSCTGAVAG
jgi:hypothetical protein